MECPKCGYKLDASATSCPRCAILGDDQPVLPAQPATPAPQRVQAAAQPVAPRPATRVITSASSSSMPVDLKQIIVIVFALLVIGSVFLPVVTMPAMMSEGNTNISLFKIGSEIPSLSGIMGGMTAGNATKAGTTLLIFFVKYLWVLLLLLGVSSIVIAILKRYVALWITGFGTLALALLLIISYTVGIIKANALMAQLAAAFSSNEKINVFTMAPLGIGAIMLLIGGIMLVTACFLNGEEA
ncbi:MAG: hypothetical protein ACYDBB_26290 [Armatimonadota bacterium]